MAALVGIRHNPLLRAGHAALRAPGKLGKVSLVACMRKHLTILDAMVRSNAVWKSPAVQTTAAEIHA